MLCWLGSSPEVVQNSCSDSVVGRTSSTAAELGLLCSIGHSGAGVDQLLALQLAQALEMTLKELAQWRCVPLLSKLEALTASGDSGFLALALSSNWPSAAPLFVTGTSFHLPFTICHLLVQGSGQSALCTE